MATLRERSMVSRGVPVVPFDLIEVRFAGDLARQKPIPPLYRRLAEGQMPDTAKIIGAARCEMTAEECCDLVSEALDAQARPSETSDDLRLTRRSARSSTRPERP